MIDKFCVKASHIKEWQRGVGAVTDSYKIVFLLSYQPSEILDKLNVPADLD